MDVFYVSLFGHRTVYDVMELDNKLTPLINELIQTKMYVSFLIGRNGEFDEYAASVIKRAQKMFGKENSEMTLVLPYTVADIEYYKEYYNGIVIPESLYGVHPKSAITMKNRWMAERSDLVIVYVKHNNGGAYTAMKYAEKLQKKVVNLCDADFVR